MKKDKYGICVHLSQERRHCMLNVVAKQALEDAASMYTQLFEYRQTDIPEDKTCTDVLQQWHVPGKGCNNKILTINFFKSGHQQGYKRLT